MFKYETVLVSTGWGALSSDDHLLYIMFLINIYVEIKILLLEYEFTSFKALQKNL